MAVIISGSIGEGYQEIISLESVGGFFACGSEPSAKEALFNKTLEVFSNGVFLKELVSGR